jgi:hypothetical protein
MIRRASGCCPLALQIRLYIVQSLIDLCVTARYGTSEGFDFVDRGDNHDIDKDYDAGASTMKL